MRIRLFIIWSCSPAIFFFFCREIDVCRSQNKAAPAKSNGSHFGKQHFAITDVESFLSEENNGFMSLSSITCSTRKALAHPSVSVEALKKTQPAAETHLCFDGSLCFHTSRSFCHLRDTKRLALPRCAAHSRQTFVPHLAQVIAPAPDALAR